MNHVKNKKMVNSAHANIPYLFSNVNMNEEIGEPSLVILFFLPNVQRIYRILLI